MQAGIETFDRVGCELLAESVRGGTEVNIRVTGSSMLASIWPGDALTVRPLRGATASPGEIVVFARDGRLYAHRVVGQLDNQSNPRLLTRGDGHLHYDPPFAASEIVGTVASIRRAGREMPITSSPARRLLSFGIRHSDLMRRAVLKIHAIRRRSWTASATESRA